MIVLCTIQRLLKSCMSPLKRHFDTINQQPTQAYDEMDNRSQASAKRVLRSSSMSKDSLNTNYNFMRETIQSIIFYVFSNFLLKLYCYLFEQQGLLSPFTVCLIIDLIYPKASTANGNSTALNLPKSYWLMLSSSGLIPMQKNGRLFVVYMVGHRLQPHPRISIFNTASLI